jgi:hypothetical protein
MGALRKTTILQLLLFTWRTDCSAYASLLQPLPTELRA